MYLLRNVVSEVSLANGGSVFTDGVYYLSAREFDNMGAWFLVSSNGDDFVGLKNGTFAVRCVRAF